MSLRDDKNWQLIEQLLAAEASGKQPRLFSSQRTLFGIPSSLDQELELYATSQLQGESSAPGEDTPVPSEKRVEHPLEPVFDERSRVLVLGTMPSPKSRETGFYYNHPRNRFWPVMAAIFDEELPVTNAEKRQLALRHHVALWDVLASCVIDGAKDVSIAECVPNNLARVTAHAPIEAVFCTGAKAAELYERYCREQTGLDCIKLPSTSPANAAFGLEQLIDAYRQILPFCS